MSTSVIDEFESAFQSMVTAITNHGTNHIHDHDEVKTTVDQTTQKFIDSARAIESWFLQKRMYLSMNNPEQLMEEDISDIKNEIERKDMMIKRMEGKIANWKAILADTPPQSGLIGPGPGHPSMMGPRPGFMDHATAPGMWYGPYQGQRPPPPQFIPDQAARMRMNRQPTPNGDNNPLSQLSNLSQNFRPRFS